MAQTHHTLEFVVDIVFSDLASTLIIINLLQVALYTLATYSAHGPPYCITYTVTMPQWL